MSQDLKCFFGLHKYIVHATDKITDPAGNLLQKILINRCENCGRIHYTRIDLTYQVPKI